MQFAKQLSVIADELVTGYALTALPLFACYFLLRNRREQLRSLVVISNVLLLFSACLYILHYFLTRKTAAYELQEEWVAYANTNRYFGPYWYVYLGDVLLRGVLPLLLLVPLIRKSVWTLVFFVPLVVLPFFIPLLMYWLGSGEFIAVTVKMEFDSLAMIRGLSLVVVIYAILLFIIYFAKSFFEKRKLQ